MIYTTKKQALEAIAKDPMNLQYASDKLKNNRAVVLEAVKKNPAALQYASNRLQGDFKIGAVIVAHHPFNIRYMTDKLDRDECFLALIDILENKNYYCDCY
jgi:hypothetical protein